MDKVERELLQNGARSLGVELSEGQLDRFGVYLEDLLVWNRRANLTAITDRLEIVEKHFIDSLAVVPRLQGAGLLLDLGAGAGFPGVPVALVRPDVEVVLVDSVQKKVGFLKALLARLDLPNARAMKAHLDGRPEQEGVPRGRWVISRAFIPPEQWFSFARAYLAAGPSEIVGMFGKAVPLSELGLRETEAEVLSYHLPRSGAQRSLVIGRPA